MASDGGRGGGVGGGHGVGKLIPVYFGLQPHAASRAAFACGPTFTTDRTSLTGCGSGAARAVSTLVPAWTTRRRTPLDTTPTLSPAGHAAQETMLDWHPRFVQFESLCCSIFQESVNQFRPLFFVSFLDFFD